jgi:biopolymer transport protein TolR
MPSISQRTRGEGRGRRRMVNEINVVPYIDVMLVLLVIFMVTAPLMPPGVIDLPKAGKSNTRPDVYLEVQVRAGGELRLRSVNAGDSQETRTTQRELASALKALRGDADLPVVISADKAVRYEAVMQVMEELQKQNVSRIALMVKPPA